MKKYILFATENPAKVKSLKERLKSRDVEMLTIKDLKMKFPVEESGNNATENAYIKAKAYYQASNMPTIGMDDSLHLVGVADEDQPETYVKRVNGKELNNEEMQQHYSEIAKKYGGKVEAYWSYGISIYDGKERKDFSWKSEPFYITDKPYEGNEKTKGYPIDSLSVSKKFNKYWFDLTDEEATEEKLVTRKGKEDAADFIANYLK